MSLENSLTKIGLSICFGLMTAVALAISGYFTYPLVLIIVILEILLTIFFLGRIKWKKVWNNKIELIALLAILGFALLAGSFHHDLALGRDTLSYVISAKQLTVSDSLLWEDFFSRPIHGVRSLDGDIYTSQFLPLYPTYLAIFYSLGKLPSLFWGNSILLFFSLSFLYFIGKKLKDEKVGLLTVLFFGTFYVTLWFSKRTLSENLLLFLVWLGILFFVSGYKSKEPKYYFLGLLPLSLTALVRGEGIFLFLSYLMTVLLVLAFHHQLKFEHFKKNILIIFLTLLNLALFKDYISTSKADYILGQLTELTKNISHPSSLGIILAVLVLLISALIYYFKRKASPAPFSEASDPAERCRIKIQRPILFLLISALCLFEFIIFYLAKTNNLTWNFFRTQYVLEMFCFYLLVIYVLIIFKGLYSRVFSKLEFWIILAISPAFLSFIEPNISLDQPWFMRRFYPIIIPCFILLAALVLVKLISKKKLLIICSISLILINLLLAWPVISFVEHKGVQEELEDLAQDFSKNDLILVEPGWGWQKWALSLHFFYDLNILPNCDLYRPEWFQKDLQELFKKYPNWKEDQKQLLAIRNFELNKEEEEFKKMISKFDNIYVISKNVNNPHPYYDLSNLTHSKTFKLTYPELETTANLTEYIKNYGNQIDLAKIRKEQTDIPPQHFSQEEINLNIYKVKDKNKILGQKAIFSDQEPEDTQETRSIKFTEQGIKRYQKVLTDHCNH